MSKDPIEYIRHIHDECLYLISVSTDLKFEDFLNDETLKRAVVRSLEIIGEGHQENSCGLQSKMEYNSMEEYGWNAR